MSCTGKLTTGPNTGNCNQFKDKDTCLDSRKVVQEVCIGAGLSPPGCVKFLPGTCKRSGNDCVPIHNCNWSDTNVLIIILIVIGSLLAAIIIGYIAMKYYKKRKMSAGGYYNY